MPQYNSMVVVVVLVLVAIGEVGLVMTVEVLQQQSEFHARRQIYKVRERHRYSLLRSWVRVSSLVLTFNSTCHILFMRVQRTVCECTVGGKSPVAASPTLQRRTIEYSRRLEKVKCRKYVNFYQQMALSPLPFITVGPHNHTPQCAICW